MVPAAIAASLAEELRELEPDMGLLLKGAAVAGDPFRLRLAADLAEVDQDRSLALVDQAISLDLLRPDRTPGHFGFRHPLLRRAVYAQAGEGWRLAAHRFGRGNPQE